MKISLALGPRKALSRQTAWGCLTSNLTLPGSGSLVAGRSSGYGQLLLALAGLLVSLIFGLRFILWQLANWSRFHGPDVDPFSVFPEVWLHIKLALLGLAIFFIGWLWALMSSLAILDSARKAERSNAPPPLL
jgi:hypothetical protein